MSCEAEVADTLAGRSLRRTTQRARILVTLRHAERDLTASEVHERLLDPAGAELEATPISLSTVYRTLEGLRDAGVVSSHEAAPGGTTFEWSAETTTHHHLRCVRCGATTEITLPRLAGLEAEIRARAGFEAHIRHMAITGTCRDCVAFEGGTSPVSPGAVR